jgi:hypothetical protein
MMINRIGWVIKRSWPNFKVLYQHLPGGTEEYIPVEAAQNNLDHCFVTYSIARSSLIFFYAGKCDY